MSNKEETASLINALGDRVRERYDEGDPLEIEIAARPQLKIVSFEPLLYEAYGRLFHRGPYIVGTMALKNFLSQETTAGFRVFAALEENRNQDYCYGFAMNSHNPGVMQAMNEIAEAVDLPIEVERT